MKAASVLPLPVGAHRRTSWPGGVSHSAITGHPSVCAGAGLPKRSANQARTAGWKASRTEAIGLIIIYGRAEKKKLGPLTSGLYVNQPTRLALENRCGNR